MSHPKCTEALKIDCIVAHDGEQRLESSQFVANDPRELVFLSPDGA